MNMQENCNKIRYIALEPERLKSNFLGDEEWFCGKKKKKKKKKEKQGKQEKDDKENNVWSFGPMNCKSRVTFSYKD